MIELRNWSFLCIYTTHCQVKTMKSKCYNIQVSYSKLWEIHWKYLMACKLICVKPCFWMKKSFCKLKNELNVIYISNVAWKLVHMTFGSYVHSLLQNSDFSKLLWAIYEFPWFYFIYFWFLILTHSYESLDGVHTSFEIFGNFI